MSFSHQITITNEPVTTNEASIRTGRGGFPVLVVASLAEASEAYEASIRTGKPHLPVIVIGDDPVLIVDSLAEVTPFFMLAVELSTRKKGRGLSSVPRIFIKIRAAPPK